MTRDEAFAVLAKALGSRSVPGFRHDRYRRGATLQYQDDVADAARLVVAGRVDLRKWRNDEATFLIREVHPGEWIGLSETIAGGPFLADGVAAPECEVLTFDPAGTRELLIRFPFALGLVLARGYYRLHAHLNLPSAQERVVELLKERGAGRTELVITQEELGRLLSLSRETVNRTLRDMEAAGMVETGRGRILLLAPLFAD